MLAEHVTTRNQLVTLDFHHILTKLNVKITITDGYKGTQPFTIKELDIVGLEDTWSPSSSSASSRTNSGSFVLDSGLATFSALA